MVLVVEVDAVTLEVLETLHQLAPHKETLEVLELHPLMLVVVEVLLLQEQLVHQVLEVMVEQEQQVQLMDLQQQEEVVEQVEVMLQQARLDQEVVEQQVDLHQIKQETLTQEVAVDLDVILLLKVALADQV